MRSHDLDTAKQGEGQLEAGRALLEAAGWSFQEINHLEVEVAPPSDGDSKRYEELLNSTGDGRPLIESVERIYGKKSAEKIKNLGGKERRPS